MTADGAADPFAPHLARWRLAADGPPMGALEARLLPVSREGVPLMLRLGPAGDAPARGAIMDWWGGDGAAAIVERDGDALLMERATGPGDLAEAARSGRDDGATRILCNVLARLHAPRPAPPPPGLVPLPSWFEPLNAAAARLGGPFARAAREAAALFAEPQDAIPLHGDLHHGNVLDFGPRGWLAIDPKGLRGERAFDYAILFSNPDLADAARPVATRPDRFEARLGIVCAEAAIERGRLLRWIVAWSGLSAAWFEGDGDTVGAATDLTILGLAAAALDREG